MQRQRAVCVSWNISFGWLQPDDGGENLFCHNTELQMAGFRRLKVGQRVFFDRQENERGLFATNVVLEADAGEEGAVPIVPAGTREYGECITWQGSYGTLRPEIGGQDCFVHFSGIEMDGFKNLLVGERVSYIRDKQDRGYVAVQVRVEEPAA